MKYIIPVLLYLGYKPKEIKALTNIPSPNIYNANKNFKDQNVKALVDEILRKKAVQNGSR